MRLLALVLFVVLTAAAPVAAQEAATGGFLFAYAPRDRELFEPGYRRHLDWHREQRDSLSWFGWDVLVGSRPGLFVDGVFGVPFEALDVRVDPAGDQRDAAANVLPYADAVGREMVVLRPDLSTADPLAAGAPTSFVQVVRYAVAPGDVRRIEEALSALRRVAADGSLLPFTVYESLAGAELGYLLMIWRDRLATFDQHDRNPERALRRMLAQLDPAGGRSVLMARSEVWRFRRDLTHFGTSQEVR